MLIDLRSVAKELEVETSKTRVTTKARREREAGVSLFRDLLQRRVPQILGLYFGASFAIIQFVQWLIDNYPVSPNLDQFSFVALASMVPTVLLLAYFHGKPGRDQWTRVEKVGVPVNLLAAVALLFFYFQDKDLGAATKTVTLKDEEGKLIDRVIPKNEFRKRVAIFYFENESGDSTSNWLQYGIPEMLEYDLDQDLYLNVGAGFYSDLKEAGFEEGIGAPLPLKKKIAGEKHLNYFVTGAFTQKNGTLSIRTMLYGTERGKLIRENSFSGADMFALVDSMSVQLRHDLEIPAYHLLSTEDLPVSEILTSSEAAFKEYISSNYESYVRNDYQAAAELLENAIKEDPTFARAHFRLYSVYRGLNRRDDAEKAIRAAIQHKYKLPERYQFWAKNAYYSIKEQTQEKIENAKNWVELYPEATEGHHVLAKQYENMNQLDDAIAEHERIFELDPKAYHELHHIGELYREQNEFEQALKYYKQYADQFPEEVGSFKVIGDLYQTMGDYEGARSSYKRALLIEPEEVSILASLGLIEIKLGNFDQALERIEEALSAAKTPQHRSSAYEHFTAYYTLRGQIAKALEYYDLYFSEMEKFVPPVVLLIA
ncbi:MAG: tetratricopeptide repeat protein, partial [bacterium]